MLLKKKMEYADDDSTSTGRLFRLRAPSLVIGLILGIGISFVTSNFEEVLTQNIQVAFFLPFIVYIADAIGTQTQNIYSRDLQSGKTNFKKYLKKELSLGLLFGIIFALFSALVIHLWLHDTPLTLSVSISAFITLATAPTVALLVTQSIQSIHKDPAVGSGPITTIIQDTLSIIIYGLVASSIIL